MPSIFYEPTDLNRLEQYSCSVSVGMTVKQCVSCSNEDLKAVSWKRSHKEREEPLVNVKITMISPLIDSVV